MSTKTFADIKALKKPNEVSVEIILNPELTRSLEELERREIRDSTPHPTLLFAIDAGAWRRRPDGPS